VRSDDIASGHDPLIGPGRDLASRYEGVDFGLLDVPIPEVPPGGGTLAAASDPVRFGRSDIITFTPHGTSSSGTLYVSDGAGVSLRWFFSEGRADPDLGFDRDLWAWTR